MGPILLDGKKFNIGIKSIERSAELKEGDNGGLVMNGRKRRDLLGTYYHYAMGIDMRYLSPKDYDAFYELLTAPVESHRLTAPYGQGSITFEAYVTGSKDMVLSPAGVNRWGGLQAQFYAMSPQRYPG